MTAYVWFVNMTFTDWNYKLNPNWQIKGAIVNGIEMVNGWNLNEGNNRNWRPWIYFEGELWGADKIGNMNLGYVGYSMGFRGAMLKNPATMDKDDGPSVELGIAMAQNRW